MTYLPDEVLFDLRLVQRHVRAGATTREEVDKRLSAMEDMADQADIIDLDKLRAEAEAAKAAKGGERKHYAED